MEQGLERKFGGFPLSVIDARARELTVINPRAKCLPSEMTIDSAVVLIFEQQQLVRKVSVDKFPCTKDEWYKYIIWPIHANGGDHPSYHPSDPRTDMTSPYAKLATTMRAPIRTMDYQRGSTISYARPKLPKSLVTHVNGPKLHTRRINARRTHRTLKCSFVEQPVATFRLHRRSITPFCHSFVIQWSHVRRN